MKKIIIEIKHQLVSVLFVLIIATGYAQIGEINPGGGAVTITDRVIHDENIILADHGYTRGAVSQQKATLYFGQNGIAIDPKLPINLIPAVFDGLSAMRDLLGKAYKIKTIQIEGWSSPEGNEVLNSKLALKRAESGKTFMTKMMEELYPEPHSIDKNTFEVISGGEDMGVFIYFLEVSAIPDKAKIISSLKTVKDDEILEKEISQLRKSYPEIDQNIFPMLRRVDITVHYNEPQYNDEEMLKMALSGSKALKFNEFLYAATLTDDLSQKITIYEWAGNITDDRWEAFNNAGCIYLMMGENEKALSYLSRANSAFPMLGTILNNLGVASIRINNSEKATSYLQQAEAEGIDISYNMGLIKLLQEKYRESVSYLEKRKCNYNLALALTFAGNLSKAAEILSCSPDIAQKYYLMAVIGARQNNISMFYGNLQKAIEIEPSLKILVQTDAEFNKYRDQLDFKEMIK